MSPPSSPSIPPPLPPVLGAKLGDLRRRLWAARLGHWAFLSLAALLIAFLLVWISDRLWDTPGPWRLGLFLTLITLSGGAALAVILTCAYRFRGARALGLLVHRWDRRQGDRLLTALALTQPDHAISESPRLRQAALDQVTGQLEPVDLRLSVDVRGCRRASRLAVTLVLVVGALLLLAPQAGMNAAHRFLLPWQPVERYTFTRLGDMPATWRVPHGEDATLALPLDPSSVWKRSHGTAVLTPSGRQRTASLEKTSSRYLLPLPGLSSPEDLHFRAGDAEIRLRLLPTHRPGLEKVDAILELPSYLHHSPREETLVQGELAVLPGTRLTLRATASRALESAERLSPDPAPLPVEGVTLRMPGPLEMPDAPEELVLSWRDVYGLTPKEPLTIRLRPIQDHPPRVALETGSGSPQTLLAADTLTLVMRAEDDYGLQTLGWVAGQDSAPPAVEEAVAGAVLLREAPEEPSLQTTFSFTPSAHALEPGTWRIWAYARDYRPGAPPVFATPRSVEILSEEAHASLIQARFRGLQEQLEAITRREADLKHANEASLAQGVPLEKATLESRQAQENANAQDLDKLAHTGKSLLAEALKNASLDPTALAPLGAMLTAMESVASAGMPQAAASLGQAAASAAQGDQTTAQDKLAEAVAQEEANLQALEDALAEGQDASEQLEAATFVNRLRRAASQEEEVATSMKASVFDTAGLPPHDLPAASQQALQALQETQTHTGQDVLYLQSDLDHYHRRTGRPQHGQIFQEMKAADLPGSLEKVGDRLRDNQHGRVIGATLALARQFHAWADALSAARQEKKADQADEGSGEGEAQADPELMWELMRLVQEEMTLRQQTRALDAAPEAPNHQDQTRDLASEQRGLALATVTLRARVLAPELAGRLEAAAGIMEEAATLLDQAETGGPTIAAQTEVIELLAQAAQTAAQMGGNAKAAEVLAEVLAMMELGNSPGGNAEGSASTLAAQEIQGETGDARPDQERRVRSASGYTSGDLPEEFREALGHYFEKREQRQGHQPPSLSPPNPEPGSPPAAP